MGRQASKLRDAFEDTKRLLEELCEFRDELQRVAGLPYKPNLSDGVLITASPLWNLFRLPNWRKDLEECWKKLEAGVYDWAHLAYSIWPDRVREVCPEFPGPSPAAQPQVMHWSIADPAAGGGSDAETYPGFRALAADLETRIGFLLALIGATLRGRAREKG